MVTKNLYSLMIFNDGDDVGDDDDDNDADNNDDQNETDYDVEWCAILFLATIL